MDIEKLIELANQGDVEAMVSVGAYYFEKSENGGGFADVETAAKWYEKAAKLNNPDGLLAAASAYSIIADVYQEISEYADAIEAWGLCYEFALCLIAENNKGDAIQISEEDINWARDILKDCKYNSALCHFFSNNYTLALTDSKYCSSAEAKVLEGLCNFNLKRYEKVYENIKFLESDEYLNKDKSLLEEIVFADSTCLLAELYRIGTLIDLAPNLERARNLLLNSLSLIKEEKLKVHINEELSKYKPKFFGGFKYVE